MSVLLVGLDDVTGPVLIRHLVAEGDVVGVVEDDPSRAETWRDAGAHVAVGSPSDPDLIERAGRHARSVVVFESAPDGSTSVMEAVLEAARITPEPPRVIVAGPVGDTTIAHLERSALDYVVLRTPAPRRWRRGPSRPEPQDLAEAVSAADDLAGDPRLIADLGDAEGWSLLGLASR